MTFRTAPLLAAATLALLSTPSRAAEEFFEVSEIPSRGRSVAAELTELDGDGRVDLWVVALEGIPPSETRIAHVYLRRADGSLPLEPDHAVPLPAFSAVYDIADLKPESPGAELVLLRPDRVTLLSLADASGKSWDLMVPGPTTVATATDERGLEPYPLVFRDFGPEPWILAPQIGMLTALTADGVVRAQIEAGRRTNYLVIPGDALFSAESVMQMIVAVPKMSVGDIDGDGRTDMASATRHEVRVFLQREDGGFANAPDRTLPLGLVTPRDHIRGSGGVVCEIIDIDGDGRLDLLISHVHGGFTDAVTTTYTHMNHGGSWNLEKPDSRYETEGSLGSNVLIDIDGDGRQELLRLELEFSLLELVELLLTQEIDANISIHRFRPEQGFDEDDWVTHKTSLGFSFQTFRPKGFIPSVKTDVNADGFLDFVNSGDGKAIELFLGNAERPFGRRNARQKMSTAGVIHFTDFDDDGLPDFVLFDPHNFDVPIRIGRNLGRLPGTRPALRSSD